MRKSELKTWTLIDRFNFTDDFYVTYEKNGCYITVRNDMEWKNCSESEYHTFEIEAEEIVKMINKNSNIEFLIINGTWFSFKDISINSMNDELIISKEDGTPLALISMGEVNEIKLSLTGEFSHKKIYKIRKEKQNVFNENNHNRLQLRHSN